jgi:hypothetical protein
MQRLDMLEKIAMPAHVIWVPLKIFAANLVGCAGIAMMIRDEFDGLAIFGPVIAFFAIHIWVATKFRQDLHIEAVWLQNLAPPNFVVPGGRRFLRLRTVNLLPVAGRKYTV